MKRIIFVLVFLNFVLYFHCTSPILKLTEDICKFMYLYIIIARKWSRNIKKSLKEKCIFEPSLTTSTRLILVTLSVIHHGEKRLCSFITCPIVPRKMPSPPRLIAGEIMWEIRFDNSLGI